MSLETPHTFPHSPQLVQSSITSILAIAHLLVGVRTLGLAVPITVSVAITVTVAISVPIAISIPVPIPLEAHIPHALEVPETLPIVALARQLPGRAVWIRADIPHTLEPAKALPGIALTPELARNARAHTHPIHALKVPEALLRVALAIELAGRAPLLG